MELNNKTLIYLISIAILITLFGTSYNLTKLQKIQSITGLVGGPVNVTVASTVSINLSIDAINWGSGRVSQGFNRAILDTNNNSAAVSGGTWSTSGINSFTLQNVGNVPVNVTINSTANATDIINGTNPQFRFEVRQATGNSTACESGIITGQNELVAKLKNRICNSFNYTLNRDHLIIDINMTIPEDSPTGSKNVTISFDACDVSSGSCTP